MRYLIITWPHGETMIFYIISWSPCETMRYHDLMVSRWDHEISHGLMVNFSIFTHPPMKFSHGLMASWWDDEIYQGPFFYFHPPHSEIFSWCHGEVTIKNLFFHEKLSLTMSITSKQKSISLMVSQWDHEIYHGLMIKFSNFNHPTVSFSHGLMLKFLFEIVFSIMTNYFLLWT